MKYLKAAFVIVVFATVGIGIIIMALEAHEGMDELRDINVAASRLEK